MNQKRAFKSDKPAPKYLHDVKVNGRRLTKGMEATLIPPVGKKEKRRYRFEYAEMLQGELMLTFFGPVRGSCQRYRNMRPAGILVVHSKSG